MKKLVTEFWNKYRIIISCTVIVACLILAFLKNQQWVNTYMATFTMVLAIATVGIIWQNHLSQNRERKERLLNEIIEWAIDISKRGSELDFLLLAAQIDEEPWGKLDIPTIQSNLRDLKQRGDYVINITGNQESLLSAANKVREEVAWYLKGMDDLFIKIRLEGGIESLPTIFKSMIEHDSLVGYANELLKEATKIKTKL
ncbi:MAG: hypothetical protein ABR958_09390 [Dehalococcoidales bacterium]